MSHRENASGLTPQLGGGNLYTVGAAGWGTHEVGRLKGMDEFLQLATRGNLAPIVGRLASDSSLAQVRLLDVGAGTGETVENICSEIGVDYYALDVNRQLLDGRSTPDSRKINAEAEHIPAVDGAFDITHSRAVTAWTPNPGATIAEQLRVTRKTAVFTEFDWSKAAFTEDSDVLAPGMAAKALMMYALGQGGFNTSYGSQLGEDIDRVAQDAGLSYERQERIIDLPPGDYRPIFLDAARGIAAHLRNAKAGGVTAAAYLEGYVKEIESAAEVGIKLPTIVTQVVHKK